MAGIVRAIYVHVQLLQEYGTWVAYGMSLMLSAQVVVGTSHVWFWFVVH